MSDDGAGAIKSPQKRPVATAARDVAEAAAQAIPVVGPLLGIASALAKTTLPPPEARDRERWEGEVTGRVNEHSRVLQRHAVEISGTTLALAEWMVRTSSDGLHEPHVMVGEVASALGSDHPAALVMEAAEELESYGLLSLTRFIGGDGLIQPRSRLFVELDPHVSGSNVEADARALAALALEADEDVSFADLEAKSGFERRRFNPAASMLLSMFDVQPEWPSHEGYPAAYAYLTGGTRARLRRFAAGQ